MKKVICIIIASSFLLTNCLQSFLDTKLDSAAKEVRSLEEFFLFSILTANQSPPKAKRILRNSFLDNKKIRNLFLESKEFCHGESKIHEALVEGDIEFFKVNAQKIANQPEPVDRNGLSPFRCAMILGETEIAKLLFKTKTEIAKLLFKTKKDNGSLPDLLLPNLKLLDFGLIALHSNDSNLWHFIHSNHDLPFQIQDRELRMLLSALIFKSVQDFGINFYSSSFKAKLNRDQFRDIAWTTIALNLNKEITAENGDRKFFRLGTKGLLEAIKNGLEINQKDEDGLTLMHIAACLKSPVSAENIEALVAAGGDPHIEDKSGQTPLHFAFICHSAQNKDALIKAIRDLNYTHLDTKAILQSGKHFYSQALRTDSERELPITPIQEFFARHFAGLLEEFEWRRQSKTSSKGISFRKSLIASERNNEDRVESVRMLASLGFLEPGDIKVHKIDFQDYVSLLLGNKEFYDKKHCTFQARALGNCLALETLSSAPFKNFKKLLHCSQERSALESCFEQNAPIFVYKSQLYFSISIAVLLITAPKTICLGGRRDPRHDREGIFNCSVVIFINFILCIGIIHSLQYLDQVYIIDR